MNTKYKNAVEDWPLYDSILIASNANTLYRGAGFFNSYQELSAPAQIPFFNVRNRSVGVQYCNMDSANKMPYVYHLQSIGIAVEAPLASCARDALPVAERTEASDLFFANDLINHLGFIFRVAQDEKMVTNARYLPSGEGIVGWGGNQTETIGNQFLTSTTVTNGVATNENRYPLPTPISIPREENIEGSLILSPYAREALAKMIGPGDWPCISQSNIPDQKPQAALIRITLYGVREVQQRNALHYAG